MLIKFPYQDLWLVGPVMAVIANDWCITAYEVHHKCSTSDGQQRNSVRLYSDG